MKKKELSDHEISRIVTKIAKPAFKKLRNNAGDEFRKIPDMNDLSLNDFINIMIGVARAIDINMISMIDEVCFIRTRFHIDHAKLLECHIENLRAEFESTFRKKRTIN